MHHQISDEKHTRHNTAKAPRSHDAITATTSRSADPPKNVQKKSHPLLHKSEELQGTNNLIVEMISNACPLKRCSAAEPHHKTHVRMQGWDLEVQAESENAPLAAYSLFLRFTLIVPNLTRIAPMEICQKCLPFFPLRCFLLRAFVCQSRCKSMPNSIRTA